MTPLEASTGTTIPAPTPTSSFGVLEVASQYRVPSQAWTNFLLLNQLRFDGFMCPQGRTFPPNSKPLVFDCRLWRASQLHAEDMAAKQYFSHQSQDGRSP